MITTVKLTKHCYLLTLFNGGFLLVSDWKTN